jgi:hypothetical protein
MMKGVYEMDDYEIDDRGCPRCGHGHTHSRKCTVGCDGGEIVEDDGLNQALPI